MKKFLTIMTAATALWLAVPQISAQTLSIHFADGTVQTHDVADIDSIVMSPAEISVNFDITIDAIESSRAHIMVNCDDPSVRYYFDLCTQAAYDAHGGDIAEIIETNIQQVSDRYPQLTFEQILEIMLDQGTTDEVIPRLPAATDMVCYVMAVDENGKCYGRAATKKFRTLDAGDPSQCTFDITATDVNVEGCTVNIRPSDGSVLYWYGLCQKAQYPGDAAMILSVKSAFSQVAAESGYALDYMLQQIGYTDEIHEIESGLERDTEYYIYVYALNLDGSNAGPLQKILFRTAAYEESDASISIAYRYFDGDEVYALDPANNEKYRGSVLLQYQVSPNESAAHWAVALGVGDMTNEDMYPEESTKTALLQMGSIDVMSKDLVVNWGDATFLYFAADEYGIDGPLKRMKINITREGVAPVSQLQLSSLQARMASGPIKVEARAVEARHPFGIKIPVPKNTFRHR